MSVPDNNEENEISEPEEKKPLSPPRKSSKRKHSPAASVQDTRDIDKHPSEDGDPDNHIPRQTARRSRTQIPTVKPSPREDTAKSPTPRTKRSKPVVTGPTKQSKLISTEPEKPKHTSRKPASLEKKNRKGETGLQSAAVKGDQKTVVHLLEQGANPNTVDNAGWSPLHEASIAGRVDIVKLLLDFGASPNLHAQEENLTPLHDAASNGFVEVVRLLVAHGANVQAKNSQGLTPREVSVSDDIIAALEETNVLMTETQMMNQSVVQQDILVPENIVLSCPQSSDTDFKKISAASTKLKLSKPNRAVTMKTTHCILDSPRSLHSVLSAQLVGAELIQSEWIYQSRQLGLLVDTEPFLLQSPDITAAGRNKSKDCRMRAQPRLFTGIHFYLTGGFDRPNLSKTDIQKLVSLSGAKLINREPDPENLPVSERTVPHYADKDSGLNRTSHIILYQEGGKREPLLKYNMDHVKTLPLTWFVQCILQHQLLDPKLFS
jgi:hypothetical protein